MEIHARFTGGNIRVLRQEGTDIFLQNELRDTMEDWFYWAFCVENAQGQTLTFHLNNKWIGYYGPAISHDLYTWRWEHPEAMREACDTFTYTFGPEESKVYFAHNMLYHPAHFNALCERLGLKQDVLCISERGREVPYVSFGEGSERIIVTARHHACEATGDYVLEGVLESLFEKPIPGLEVIIVPFVDYDGVLDGDQGKSRAPYDHNRDYIPDQTSRYASIRRIRQLASEKPLRYAFDFHSPWHLGGMNDWVFIPQKHYDILKNMTRFARFWEECQTEDALPYTAIGTLPVDTDWNNYGSPCFGTYMHATAGAELAFTVETPYFTCSGVPFDPDKAREMGRCFVKGLRRYHERPAKISFTGDILYNGRMNELSRTETGYDYMPMFKRVWTRLPDTDYLVGNLETPVAGEENDGFTHDRYRFNTPDQALAALRKSGFDALTLANNHCMDRGIQGLFATVKACENAGFDTMGMYTSQETRNEVFVRDIRGIRVGFVNATYGTNAFAHHTFLPEGKAFAVRLTQPEETLPGSIHLLEPEEEIAQKTREMYEANGTDPRCAPFLEDLRDILARTKAECDYLIMLLHSGGQYNLLPDAYTRMLTEKIYGWGADLVVCNHPHIILPSEIKDGRFTAFCLGNLMYTEPGYMKPGCPVCPDFSAVLNVTLEKKDNIIKPRFSFRVMQIVFDPDGSKAPWSEDTFDRWQKQPSDSYTETILYYANLFAPGQNYVKVQAEYPISI